MVIELIILLFILLYIGLISYILKHQIYIHTSTMASIMAFGIVLQGVMNLFFGDGFFHTNFAKILITFIVALWVSFWSSIFISLIKRKWKSLHYKNPVNRFGIGTWIAASSICGVLLANHFPIFTPLVRGLSWFNAALWIFYCWISVKAIMTIFRLRIVQVHGILLLTTVSTQSLIILFHNVYTNVPKQLTYSLLTVGFCFYILGTFLIVKRYTEHSWSVETDWNNTNCILHGALSISGVASIVSGAFNEQSLFVLWGLTVTIFLIVEGIEIYRLIRLVKESGWKRAVFVYNVSQWSRIFTFSMFYTFTGFLPVQRPIISSIQEVVINVGFWVIIALVLIEIILVLQLMFRQKETKQQLQESA